MLAEIEGKISRSGSNLSERIEDNLTGNVFGALRYIPFSEGLGEVLANGVFPNSSGENLRKLSNDYWADKIEFWPYDREGEIDVLIQLEEITIGIEVKYYSGLSSDDEVKNIENNHEEIEQSLNQLARESRILSKKGAHKKKLLLFIADRKSCREVYSNVTDRKIIERGVELAYISWQDFLYHLKNLRLKDPFHDVVIQDLIALLTRKGFEDFTNMLVKPPKKVNSEDYFNFDIQHKVKLDFTTSIPISGGLYYEFEREY